MLDSSLESVEGCQNSDQSEDAEKRFSFKPPLFRQRDQKVYEILKSENVKSIVELGCADCRLLFLYKNLNTFEKIIGVELDKSLLINRIDRLKPLIHNYLNKRERPLHIQLFQGNLLKFDNRIADCEVVSLMEVIEHLVPEDLEQLPMALFGRLQPKLAIITTPNSEFNVLFSKFSGFRHWDHKFEWSRAEFASWCSDVMARFPYSVTYDGVGEPPDSHQHVGYCTQFAIFRRHDDAVIQPVTCDQQPYELIGEVFYPVKEPMASEKDCILNETEFYLTTLSQFALTRLSYSDEEDENVDDGIQLSSDESSCSISIDVLFSYPKIKQACSNDLQKFIEVLHSKDFEFTDDGLSIVYPLPNKSRFYDDDDKDDLVRYNDEITTDDVSETMRNFDINSCEEEDWDLET